MSSDLSMQVEQPLGRLFSLLGKGYLHILRSKLQHLDIDRYYYALVLIANHEGDITQQELTQLLDTDKVSVLRTVDYLSEKGYVQRVRKTNDRRKLDLLLTEKAKRAIPEIKKAFKEMNEMVTNGLPLSMQDDLVELINKIKKNITENTQTI